MNNFANGSFHSDDAFCALLPQVKADVGFVSHGLARNDTPVDEKSAIPSTKAIAFSYLDRRQ